MLNLYLFQAHNESNGVLFRRQGSSEEIAIMLDNSFRNISVIENCIGRILPTHMLQFQNFLKWKSRIFLHKYWVDFLPREKLLANPHLNECIVNYVNGVEDIYYHDGYFELS